MQQVLARKNVQKTNFKAAEMILDPWNQQTCQMWVCQDIDKLDSVNQIHHANMHSWK